jgi:uroporphyrinogen decarboxylase
LQAHLPVMANNHPTMTSRERVLCALDHREPDRIPVDFWAAREVSERLRRHFAIATHEDLLSRLGVDLRVVEGPSYVGQEMGAAQDGAAVDLWGVPRKPVTVGAGERAVTYMEVTRPPLAGATTVAEIEAYSHWPSPEWWDYSHLAQQCRRHAGLAVVNAGDRKDRTAQLKPAMYLRGVEQAMLDLVENPSLLEAILERVTHYFLEYNRRVFEAAAGRIDIFMMGDDFGMQQGPLMSLTAWRRFFRPGFRAYIELAHSYGIKVMHHTCGSVRALIPDFIECGLDILQSLQPRAAGMDLGQLKHEFGRDLCFHGSVDIQQTLPRGTPAQVREEVRRRMEAGKPGGGFIICTAHNLQPDTPTENILALLEAYRDYGRY